MSELFDRLTKYRNHELGHGALGTAPANFYQARQRRAAGGRAGTARPAWTSCSAALIYVPEVRLQTSGGCDGRAL